MGKITPGHQSGDDDVDDDCAFLKTSAVVPLAPDEVVHETFKAVGKVVRGLLDFVEELYKRRIGLAMNSSKVFMYSSTAAVHCLSVTDERGA
jgi:hypothetical protein